MGFLQSERRLTRFDRQAMQIVAVKPDEIERVEHGDITGTSAAQRLKVCEPVRPDHAAMAAMTATLARGTVASLGADKAGQVIPVGFRGSIRENVHGKDWLRYSGGC
jgi:hypothetical protein